MASLMMSIIRGNFFVVSNNNDNALDGVSDHQPQLFTQPFIRAQINENMKALRHWPLCGEFTRDRWIPRTNRQ